MSLITPAEVNAIAFSPQIDSALILDEIISAAEESFIIPAITQPVYNDLSVNPGMYSTLVQEYIKPYLAFCVKLLLYNQYLTGTGTFTIPTQQRWDVIQEITVISKAKKNLLVKYLSASAYPLFKAASSRRITGFLIK